MTRIFLIHTEKGWLLGRICNNPYMKRRPLAAFYMLILATPFLSAVLADPALAGARPQKTIDLQGHRGARGLLPENTIPAFLLALDLEYSKNKHYFARNPDLLSMVLF